jgi:hypothetical protein
MDIAGSSPSYVQALTAAVLQPISGANLLLSAAVLLPNCFFFSLLQTAVFSDVILPMYCYSAVCLQLITDNLL